MSEHRFSRRNALKLVGATAALAAFPGCGDDAPEEDRDAGGDGGLDAAPDGGQDAAVDVSLPPLELPFAHGVASGDPFSDSVILWTRVTFEEPPSGDVDVGWVVARDAMLLDVVTSGMATTNADRDFTVKIEATGLDAGTSYYYRFELDGERSAIGRTRTAPVGAIDRLRFAMVSCASFAHGFFHAYRNIAARTDLDAVLHLGDYIYEYGDGEFGDVRTYEPSHECLSLADYRARYAHYRRDPDLKELHRQHPIIAIWDDHETANNAWSGGAANHQEDEGSWPDRRAAGTRAHREWMPIRETEDGHIWRSLRYGDLAEIVALDTRLWHRDEQAANGDDPSLASDSRQLLGEDQEAWLDGRLTTTAAQWKLLAQQIMVGQLTSVFLNTDGWDGYPAARRRLLSTIRDAEVDDVVILTGDIHTSWVFDIVIDPTDPDMLDRDTGAGSLAVEFVTPGVTSPGLGEALQSTAEREAAMTSHVRYTNVFERGYVLLDVTPERVQAAWFFIDDIQTRDGHGEHVGAVFEVATGTHHAVMTSEPAADRNDAPDPAP